MMARRMAPVGLKEFYWGLWKPAQSTSLFSFSDLGIGICCCLRALRRVRRIGNLVEQGQIEHQCAYSVDSDINSRPSVGGRLWWDNTWRYLGILLGVDNELYSGMVDKGELWKGVRGFILRVPSSYLQHVAVIRRLEIVCGYYQMHYLPPSAPRFGVYFGLQTFYVAKWNWVAPRTDLVCNQRFILQIHHPSCHAQILVHDISINPLAILMGTMYLGCCDDGGMPAAKISLLVRWCSYPPFQPKDKS